MNSLPCLQLNINKWLTWMGENFDKIGNRLRLHEPCNGSTQLNWILIILTTIFVVYYQFVIVDCTSTNTSTSIINKLDGFNVRADDALIRQLTYFSWIFLVPFCMNDDETKRNWWAIVIHRHTVAWTMRAKKRNRMSKYFRRVVVIFAFYSMISI